MKVELDGRSLCRVLMSYNYDSLAECYQFASKTIVALLEKPRNMFITCIPNEGKLASDIFKPHLCTFAVPESRGSIS